MELIAILLNTICQMIQTVALVMIAFELNPWQRKGDNAKQ